MNFLSRMGHLFIGLILQTAVAGYILAQSPALPAPAGWEWTVRAEGIVAAMPNGWSINADGGNSLLEFGDPGLIESELPWLVLESEMIDLEPSSLGLVVNWSGLQFGVYRDEDLLFPAFVDGDNEWYALGEGIALSAGAANQELWAHLSPEGRFSLWVLGDWYLWDEPIRVNANNELSIHGPQTGVCYLTYLDLLRKDGTSIVSGELSGSSSFDSDTDAVTSETESDVNRSPSDKAAVSPFGAPPSLIPSLAVQAAQIPPPPLGKILFVRPEGGEYEFDPNTLVIRMIRITPGILIKQ